MNKETKRIDIHEIFKDKDFIRACVAVIESGKATTAFLQNQFGWDYEKVMAYFEHMANFGYVSLGFSNRKVTANLDVFKADAKENFYIND